MKNYFNFNLTGKKLLPIWLLFLVLFIVPYGIMVLKINDIQTGEIQSLLIFPLLMVLFVIAFLLTFYITKLIIEGVVYNDKMIVFNGTFGKFIGMVLLGFFLSIITLGIYMAWFIRDINRFFINNSSYDSQSLKFQGKGGRLFVILLLTIIIPISILSIVMTTYILNNVGQPFSFMLIQQLITVIIMIPYMYFVYKWMVNIDYKDFNITWKTSFWISCGKIAFEILLTIITLGIYFPMAMIRLYKYFADKTIANGTDRKLKFGYDIDPLNDFLFIWGQTLLTIITLGIYYPWAFCKIGKRILSKTYLTEY